MNGKRHRQLIAFGTGLAAICLVVIGLLTTNQVNRLTFDDALITNAESVIDALHRVQAAVRMAEANHHGYLLTGESQDFQSFEELLASFDSRLAEVQQTVRDLPRQARPLTNYRGLLLQERDLMSMLTVARRERGLDAARELLITTRERHPTEEMQLLLEDILSDAQSMIAARRADRALDARNVRVLVFLSLGVMVVGGLVVALQMRDEIRRRRASERDAHETLQQVDLRVQERTRELSEANENLQRALSARAEALTCEQQARADSEHANEAKDRFLATVSHELRTPLNAIVGWVQLLKMGTLSAEDMGRAIDAIERNSKVQARLVGDLLDVAQMNQGRLALVLEPVDLRAVVDRALDAARSVADAKGVVVTRMQDPSPVNVSGDETRLHQAVANLLANAVKFTPRGGRVTVAVARDGDRASLQVRDNGDGIEPEFLPHVFDPFLQGPTRSMRAGLGLGLAIVKEIVVSHGGTVRAESGGAGQGSTFTVLLPLTR